MFVLGSIKILKEQNLFGKLWVTDMHIFILIEKLKNIIKLISST